MLGKKLHELAHAHPDPELLANGLRPGLGNAGNLRQAHGLPLHNFQGLVSEFGNNPSRRNRADAFYHPSGKIGLNLSRSLRKKPFQELRLELAAIVGMGAPFPRHHQPLSHHGQRDGPHHGHRLLFSHVQPKNAVAVVIILVYHRFDGPLQNFQLLCQCPYPLSFPGCASGIQRQSSSRKIFLSTFFPVYYIFVELESGLEKIFTNT